MDNKIKQLLYESFDRELNEKEKVILNVALTDSEELQKEKENIIRMREKLSNQTEQRFGTSFIDRVMNKVQKISKQKDRYEFFENIYLLFRPVVIAATILIITMVSLNFLKREQISLEGAIAVPEVTLSDAYDPITNFNLE
jgi:hypothetical protein